MNRLAVIAGGLALVVIAVLAVLLANSRADLSVAESNNRVLQSDNALQGQVIATQAFNVNRFNAVAQQAAHANQLIAAGAEKTVIEYREILKREKTCDYPVPAAVAGGLLSTAARLRASALHGDSGQPDTADAGATSSGGLTYCQAILWIAPLLAVIEQGNARLGGIRSIETERQH
ncbi:hypothetical protein [Kosakonia sacchari]|uniref:hypothetical protein n=1 Tax=Kosakonia sacchari TaxID=1158459 RepID=UPI001585A3E7|nr:hypothetical protein [Kosakonia sacchari]NUL36622.1 hypothetical protein [Kosakonia sacchari]